jgi:hypothetical protein
MNKHPGNFMMDCPYHTTQLLHFTCQTGCHRVLAEIMVYIACKPTGNIALAKGSGENIKNQKFRRSETHNSYSKLQPCQPLNQLQFSQFSKIHLLCPPVKRKRNLRANGEPQLVGSFDPTGGIGILTYVVVTGGHTSESVDQTPQFCQPKPAHHHSTA